MTQHDFLSTDSVFRDRPTKLILEVFTAEPGQWRSNPISIIESRKTTDFVWKDHDELMPHGGANNRQTGKSGTNLTAVRFDNSGSRDQELLTRICVIWPVLFFA